MAKEKIPGCIYAAVPCKSFKMRKILTAAAAIALCCIGALSQTITPYRGIVKDGYNFWLSTPSGGDSSSKKPLVIFLHGSSLCGNDLNRVLRYGTMAAVKKGLNIDAYVIAPQNPGGSWNPAKVMAGVDWVEQHYPVDTDRVYVLGMSLGGYGTIDLAAAYHDRIAAAMALCGGATSPQIENLNNVPLWIVHGTADRAVSITQSDKVVNRMRTADPSTPRLHYDRVPGMNHGQPARLFYMPSVYRWLFEHSLADDKRPLADKFTIDLNVLRSAYRSLQTDRTIIAPRPTIDAIGNLPETSATRSQNAVTTAF